MMLVGKKFLFFNKKLGRKLFVKKFSINGKSVRSSVENIILKLQSKF